MRWLIEELFNMGRFSEIKEYILKEHISGKSNIEIASELPEVYYIFSGSEDISHYINIINNIIHNENVIDIYTGKVYV